MDYDCKIVANVARRLKIKYKKNRALHMAYTEILHSFYIGTSMRELRNIIFRYV